MNELKTDQSLSSKSNTSGILGWIERIGNRLPDPFTLFIALCLIIILLSWIGAKLSWSAIHPGTNEEIQVFSLLTREGISQIFVEVPNNIANFFPLIGGIIIMLGIAMIEKSGLASAALRNFALNIKPKYMTMVIVFLGVSSSVASDVGFMLLPPLAGMLFYAIGRNPIAGIIAGYASVAAGFNASILIGIVEVVGFSLAEEAGRIIDPNLSVPVLSNYYFTFVSAIILPITAYFVTEKIVVPRLGEYKRTDLIEENNNNYEVTAIEKRGLRNAGIAAVVYILIILAMVVPEAGILRNPETGEILDSPFMSAQVLLITGLFFIPGLVFGITTKKIKSDKDAVKIMSDGIASFSGYIVIAIIAAQVIMYFNWSNIGIISAIKGAEFLEGIGMPPLGLLLSFVLFVCFLNLVMASAAAKWALISPIFVPLFMLLDLHPAAAYLAYRIGDSVTNAITPMLAYFIILLGFVDRYQKNTGIGTLISSLLPYTIWFLIIWSLQLIIWYILGLPLGPGVGFHLE